MASALVTDMATAIKAQAATATTLEAFHRLANGIIIAGHKWSSAALPVWIMCARFVASSPAGAP